LKFIFEENLDREGKKKPKEWWAANMIIQAGRLNEFQCQIKGLIKKIKNRKQYTFRGLTN
jgi:hypothetical protein